MAEILVGNICSYIRRYFKFSISEKQVNCLLVFLVAGRWRLVAGFFCQFLFEAAFTITMHHRLIPVFAEIFGYVVLVGVIFSHYYNLAKGLQQYAYTGYYSYQLFQKLRVNTTHPKTKLQNNNLIFLNLGSASL